MTDEKLMKLMIGMDERFDDEIYELLRRRDILVRESNERRERLIAIRGRSRNNEEKSKRDEKLKSSLNNAFKREFISPNDFSERVYQDEKHKEVFSSKRRAYYSVRNRRKK
mgnify:CR=1 FL=1